jgi:hypothetical protein
MLNFPFVTSAAAVVLGACASAGQRSARCGLRAQDSTYAASAAVYRDCAVDRKAELTTTNVHPDLGSSASRLPCRSAELEFVVGPAGTIELATVRSLRATDREFGDAVLALLPQLRYRPATLDGVPVRQITTYASRVNLVRVVAPAGSAPGRPSASTKLPSC